MPDRIEKLDDKPTAVAAFVRAGFYLEAWLAYSEAGSDLVVVPEEVKKNVADNIQIARRDPTIRALLDGHLV